MWVAFVVSGCLRLFAPYSRPSIRDHAAAD
jgi:hypothetical protein